MVKDYYCLTEQEKQLLRDYKLWNQENPFYIIILFLSFLVYFILMMIGSILGSYNLTGMGVLGLMLSQLGMYWFFKKIKKQNRLIFGFDNANKYFFEITKKDNKISLKEFVTPEQKEE